MKTSLNIFDCIVNFEHGSVIPTICLVYTNMCVVLEKLRGTIDVFIRHQIAQSAYLCKQYIGNLNYYKTYKYNL